MPAGLASEVCVLVHRSEGGPIRHHARGALVCLLVRILHQYLSERFGDLLVCVLLLVIKEVPVGTPANC